MRLNANTRKGYERNIARFAEWLKDNYPNCYDEQATTPIFKVILPLSEVAVSEYLASKYTEEDGFKSVSLMESIRSAINHLYRERGHTMELEVRGAMDSYVKGYRRRMAKAKEEGQAPMIEGKDPLSVRGYRLLCEKALHFGPRSKVGGGAHLYLTMQWNLMARSSNIAALLYQHFSWENDSLVIRIPRHKGDQEGRKAMLRHVYANSEDPTVCPVTALGIHILCNPYRVDGDQRVFHQYSIKRDFSYWLVNTLKTLSDVENDVIGSTPEDIGTHSVRKGVATYISSLPGTVTMVALFLRMGWSLGNVASRYLFEGEGGQDQMIGRLATLLPPDVRIATLPPHFASEECLGNIAKILPYYHQYPAGFKKCIPFLLASVIYHSDRLKEIFPPQHVLFSSDLFADGHVDRLKNHILKSLMYCKETGMTASGVPTHIASTEEIHQLRNEIQALTEDNNNRMSDLKDTLPLLVATEVLNNCSVNGAVGVTATQLAGVEDSIKEHISTLLSAGHTNSSGSPTPDTNSTHLSGVYPLYSWGGKWRRLPATFVFPRCGTKTLWDLWFKGNLAEAYPPFCKLDCGDIHARVDKNRLRKAQGLISYMMDRAIVMKEIPSMEYISACRYVLQLPVTERDGIFNRVFPIIIGELKCDASNIFTSVYNSLCLMRASVESETNPNTK